MRLSYINFFWMTLCSTGQKYIYTGSHDSCIYIYDVVRIKISISCLSYSSLGSPTLLLFFATLCCGASFLASDDKDCIRIIERFFFLDNLYHMLCSWIIIQERSFRTRRKKKNTPTHPHDIIWMVGLHATWSCTGIKWSTSLVSCKIVKKLPFYFPLCSSMLSHWQCFHLGEWNSSCKTQAPQINCKRL